MPNNWQPLFMPAISSSVQHIRSSPAWIGLLFFFPSLFRIDLFVVCAAVVAAEIDKRAWEKQRIFSIQSASKKIRKNLSPSSSNWEWRILSIIQLMTSLYATMKLHFVRPCASPTHNRAGLCYAPAHDDGFQTEIPASQTNFCCAPVWLTPFLLRSATVQIFYIAESGWGWPAGRWHVYSSSFRDATQSSRAVCPSSISLPQIIASINPDGLWQHCWTPGKIKETTTTKWDMVCASLPSTAPLKAQYMQMRVDWWINRAYKSSIRTGRSVTFDFIITTKSPQVGRTFSARSRLGATCPEVAQPFRKKEKQIR